jgi:hypothetical protein
MRYKGIKGKAWEAVKKSVRRREKHCYTCPAKNLVGKNAQAGHYRPIGQVGSNNTWSWDPRFIHMQCSRCNGAGQGEQAVYRQHLVKDYGEAAVKEFDDNWRRVSPIKDWDFVIHTFDVIGL